MKNSFVIAKYSFFEILKSKVSLASVMIGAFIFLMSFISSEFTFGDPRKVAIDLGLGCLSIASVVIAMIYGVGLIKTEIENRTIFMVFSRPISREEFLIGKFLGLSGVILLNLTLLFAFSVILYLFMGGEVNRILFHSFNFIVIKALIVLMITILISLKANKVITTLMSFSIYATGSVINDIINTQFVKTRPIFSSLLNFYHKIFPAFYKFNLKEFFLYEERLPANYIMYGYLYSLFWLAFLTTLSIIIFKRIEFE